MLLLTRICLFSETLYTETIARSICLSAFTHTHTHMNLSDISFIIFGVYGNLWSFYQFIELPNRNAWFVSPENMFPVLWSLVTWLHPTLSSSFVDLQLWCICSAMQTHLMKLSMYCSWPNLKVTWHLEGCSRWLSKNVVISAQPMPQHLLTPLCSFMLLLTLWYSFYGLTHIL